MQYIKNTRKIHFHKNMWFIFWMFGAVIVSAIPILVRLLATFLSIKTDGLIYVSSVDITLMGIALNWTNINEGLNIILSNKRNKVFNNLTVISLFVLSVLFIVFFAVLLGFLYYSDILDHDNFIALQNKTLYITIPVTISSLVLSYIYIRKLKTISL